MPVLSRLPLAFVAGLVSLASLVMSGCDDPKRRQCVALVDAINPHTAVLSRAVEHLADVQGNPEVIGELRSAVEEANKGVNAVALEDTTLSKLALRYREQLQTAVSIADDLQAAGKDPAKLNAVVAAADGFLSERDAILGDLNEYCADKS